MKHIYPRRRLGRKGYFIFLLIIGAFYLVKEVGWFAPGGAFNQPTPGQVEAPPGSGRGERSSARIDPAEQRAGAAMILEAFASRESGLWVEAIGPIVRQLPDDNEGSRHQRYIVEIQPGHTILLSHNIDLASPLTARTGDTLAFRGRYEWNDRGGVVHWTHHDPQGRHSGGWVRVVD